AVLTLALCLPPLTLGQSAGTTGTIKGTVTLEADNSPLHQATVFLSPIGRSVHTEDDGSYAFTDLPPGTYTVNAQMNALAAQKQTVTITGGATVEANFALRFAALRQEVTVTASGREETTLESFQTVTSVPGYQLLPRTGTPSLGDLLDQEVGVAKRSYGPGTARPVIRGFDGDRVLVLQDGTRTGTLSSQSGDHGEPANGLNIERLEVVRGPATLLYGSNAIGGVVNVITRHNEMEQHPHSGVRGTLSGTGGTANGLGGGNGFFEFGAGDFLFWGGGGGLRTGDYKTPIGTVENSATEMRNASIGMGRHGNRNYFSLSYGFQNGLYGVPFIEEHSGEDHEAGDPGHEHAHENVKLDWRRHNVRVNAGLRNLDSFVEGIRGTLNYSDWGHDEIEVDRIGTRFSNKQFTYQGMFEQQRRGAVSGSFGAWGLHRDFDAVGEEALSPPARHNALAVFGVEEFSLEGFRLQIGARVENNRYSVQGFRNRSFTGVSGAAGVYVPLWPNGAFIANYTTSYRAPALEELYFNGPHLGNLAFEIGNENLDRERGHGFEIALRHQNGRIRAEVNGFLNRMNNFVFLAPTGEIEEGLIGARYSQADARYLGVEAKVEAALHQNLWLNLGFDAVDAQIRATGMPLPRIPPARGRIGLDLKAGGLSVRPELILANRAHQVFSTEEPTAGYGVFNVLGTYSVVRGHSSHLFGVNFFNAGDTLYRNHLSLIKAFAPEIGRGIRFSYTFQFY
ncbi:MAG: TonB-dependent receptor, partial [Bryobacteraceae bacterium]